MADTCALVVFRIFPILASWSRLLSSPYSPHRCLFRSPRVSPRGRPASTLFMKGDSVWARPADRPVGSGSPSRIPGALRPLGEEGDTAAILSAPPHLDRRGHPRSAADRMAVSVTLCVICKHGRSRIGGHHRTI